MKRSPSGRAPYVRGEEHGNTRLTADIVREIRRLDAQKVKRKVIAARFDISATFVGLICRGLRWGHVLA